jgi:trimeric autotransporter adhesin
MGTGTTQADVLSLGAGIRYQDLKLSKSGNSLILNIVDTAGGTPASSITLQNWYADESRRNISALQMITAASADYLPGSTNPLVSHQVTRFDFLGIVAAFDQARGAKATFANWTVSPSLGANYLAGSNSEAMGGELAWKYATQGAVDGMLLPAMRQQLTDFALGTPQIYQQTGA